MPINLTCPFPSKLHCVHFHLRQLLLRLRPTRCCSIFSQKTPHIWYCLMDWCPWPYSLWVPEAQVIMRPAIDAYPPLQWLTQLTQSLLASQLSTLHWYMLEWCHSHLETCHFQLALFLTDSQSALFHNSGVSPSPIKVLLGYLGPLRLPLLPHSSSFQWVPGNAGSQVMNWQAHSP